MRHLTRLTASLQVKSLQDRTQDKKWIVKCNAELNTKIPK